MKRSAIKILITAVGCPGSATLIRELKAVKERKIEIVGVDMDENVIGKFLCDKFYQVPSVDGPSYISKIIEIVDIEKPDVLFPQSSMEIILLSFYKEGLKTKVVVSDIYPLSIAINKYKTYQALNGVVPLPKYFYSENGFCFKPVEGKGGRGINIFDSDGLVMEKLEGEHIDAMALCWQGEVLLITIKTRERFYGGTITYGKLVSRPEIEKQIRKIIKAIPLSYNISLQFIDNKLIEINPRTSTYIFQPDLNEPYLAIKLALGEITPEEIKKYQSKVKYGRKMIRYFDQIFYD